MSFGVASGKHQGEWAVWVARFRDGERIGVNILTPAEARELARELCSHADRMRNLETLAPIEGAGKMLADAFDDRMVASLKHRSH